MAIRKNTHKQSPRTRTSRRIDDDSDMAAFNKELRTLCEIVETVPDDDSFAEGFDPKAVKDAIARYCLKRVLDAVALAGDDKEVMQKAAPALEALSEGPLSDTAYAFLDQFCSHLRDHGQLGRQG